MDKLLHFINRNWRKNRYFFWFIFKWKCTVNSFHEAIQTLNLKDYVLAFLPSLQAHLKTPPRIIRGNGSCVTSDLPFFSTTPPELPMLSSRKTVVEHMKSQKQEERQNVQKDPLLLLMYVALWINVLQGQKSKCQ